MINKIRWLWKQFTGGIVTAYGVGIFKLILTINDTITYLSTLSIQTANDAHLTLIGEFMGLVRPMITFYAETYFWFTRYKEHIVPPQENKGFGDLNDPSIGGGQFIDLYDPAMTGTSTLGPEVIWRPFLLATVASNAEIGSVKWLDDMIEAFTVSGQTPYSYYQWWNIGDTTVRAPGDMEVFLGAEEKYGALYKEIQEMLSLSVNALINPERYADITFAEV